MKLTKLNIDFPQMHEHLAPGSPGAACIVVVSVGCQSFCAFPTIDAICSLPVLSISLHVNAGGHFPPASCP